jgi:hypothetical protein
LRLCISPDAPHSASSSPSSVAPAPEPLQHRALNQLLDALRRLLPKPASHSRQNLRRDLLCAQKVARDARERKQHRREGQHREKGERSRMARHSMTRPKFDNLRPKPIQPQPLQAFQQAHYRRAATRLRR